MASPRPSAETQRRDGNYDRERRRDGGKGQAVANPVQTGGAAVGDQRRTAARPDKAREGERAQEGEEGEDRIGPYVIGEEVGRGSFATVFKGARYDTGSLVAVKSVIRSKLTSKLLENLESEISILKRITHRNIVELKDCLKTETHIYLIMAFCSAGDLSIYIRKRGELPVLTASNQGLLPSDQNVNSSASGRILYPHPKEGGLNETIVRHFLGQLVDALKFLRAQNVIHRDIKPQNLLLQPAEEADLAAGHPVGIPVLKVADFGFARWLPSQSLAETLCGSPLYMAPEILRYEKYDAKADLWSVGAVLFEMSVGKPPFRAQNHVDLLRKIERGEDKIKFPDEKRSSATTTGDANLGPEAPRSSSSTPAGGEGGVEKVAQDLKTLIRRLLKRNPAERMSFEEFFLEAKWVAEGGSAEGLVSAGMVSKRYNAERERIAAGGTRVDSAGRRHSRDTGEEQGEAAFVKSQTSSTSISRSSPRLASPSPPLIPPPSTNPYSGGDNDEPPPFARQPSNRASPTPTPSGIRRTPSFAPKYVVGRSPSPATTSGATTTTTTSGGEVRSRDFAVPSTREVVATNEAGDRRLSSREKEEALDDSEILGREYVVVEKRTVEINALADGQLFSHHVEYGSSAEPDVAELANAPKRETTIARRPSRGFLSRPLSSLGVINPSALSTSPHSPILPSNPSPTTYDTSTPPFAIPQSQQRIAPAAHPYSLSSSPRQLSYLSSSPRSSSSPIERFPGSPLALVGLGVGGGTAAIAKALNMASLKIFGSPTDGILLRRSSARKPITRSASSPNSSSNHSSSRTISEEEERVLAELEDIAQKALVIFDFADSKIIQILPPTPQTALGTSLGTPSYFSHVAARAESSSSSSNPFSPIPTSLPNYSSSPSSANNGTFYGTTTANNNNAAPKMRRTSSSSSDAHRQSHSPVVGGAGFVMATAGKTEVLAAEAMVLYLKALAFLGKGIEGARVYWVAREGREGGERASVDFNEAVQWFRQRFNECFDKAEFAKSRSLDDIPESATFAEKLIYDRALEISRAAAVNELRGENPTDCETAYETALWMLYAILDETMSPPIGDEVEEEDRTTVNKFIASITTRLTALRKKIGESR